jgi:predicted DNA-binding helix-hairpin-helix protein
MMDTFQKLRLLTDGAGHEEEGVPSITMCGGGSRAVDPELGVTPKKFGVFHAQMGGGKTIPLLKTMLTTACENDCHYCVFRQPRNVQRYSFSPEEMAEAFMKMVRAGVVRGIFLSSGIAGSGVKSQDRLIKTIEILRQRYHYRGYIHLKVMPGSEEAQIERCMQICDRVSINLEGPNPQRLKILAPKKDLYGDLFPRIQMMDRFRKHRLENKVEEKTASITTQLVVGGAGETDVETLQISELLYKRHGLARVYYSAFSPAADTPLEGQPPMDYTRYVRLYQASFLLRDYGFGMEELPFHGEGFLPLEADPKLAWARQNYEECPVEINKAEKETLLRIPGIGKLGAERIYNGRKERKLTELKQLAELGISPKRAAPFILLDGHKPVYQMDLWNYAPSALSEIRLR